MKCEMKGEFGCPLILTARYFLYDQKVSKESLEPNGFQTSLNVPSHPCSGEEFLILLDIDIPVSVFYIVLNADGAACSKPEIQSCIRATPTTSVSSGGM